MARAQGVVYSLRHFSTDDGLPDRSVQGMAQDRQGFLWLATPAGVVRFDGRHFRPWTRADGATRGNATHVFTDPDGLLWVAYGHGTANDQITGIDLIDPVAWTVTTFEKHFGAQAPCGAAQLAFIIKASRGDLVLTTVQGGLLRYTGGGRFHQVPVQAATRIARWFPLGAGYAGVDAGPHATVCLVDSLGRAAARFPFKDRVEALPGVDPEQDGLYWAMRLNARDRMEYWLAPDGRLHTIGLFRLRDRWVSALRVPLSPEEMLVDATVRRRTSDTTAADGLVLFDLSLESPAIDATIRTVFRDGDGRLWLGTGFGLYELVRTRTAFRRMLHQQRVPLGYGMRIRGLVAKDSVLYANTEMEGVFKLDARTGAVLASDTGRVLRYGLAMDADGSLWGWEDRSIVQRNAKDLKVIRRMAMPPRQGYVWSLVRQDGNHWLLGTENGLRVLDTRSGLLSTFGNGRPVEGLDAGRVEHIGRDAGGQLWVCSVNGLFRLGDGQVLEHWCTTDPAHHLPVDHVLFCMEDRHGLLWLGTKDAGLVRLDRRQGTVHSFATADGFPDHTAYAALEDGQGHIWVSTDHGLVDFEPGQGAATIFRRSDGIAQDEFNRTAHAQGDDGLLYFGGLNGLTAFNPAEVRASHQVRSAPLAISSFKQYDAASGRLEDRTVDVVRTRHITMRPGDRFLQLGLALLSYTDLDAITYGWRMDGMGGEWNEQRDPDLVIWQLPYGDRRLLVRASVANGLWTTQELALTIAVPRPFYRTWWFLALVVLAAAAGVIALFRYRLAQARRVFAVRDRIAADLHDEIGSTLSSVALYAAVAHQRSPDPETGGVLDRITEGANAALESMNDIVWSINSRFDGVGHLFDRMRAIAVLTAEEHGFVLHFSTTGPVEHVKLDMEQRKNLYLFFREAVHNVAKHAACSSLDVALEAERHRLVLCIADNGKGMATNGAGADYAMGANGLVSMRKRAEALHGRMEIRSQTGQGTTVSLEVPL